MFNSQPHELTWLDHVLAFFLMLYNGFLNIILPASMLVSTKPKTTAGEMYEYELQYLNRMESRLISDMMRNQDAVQNLMEVRKHVDMESQEVLERIAKRMEDAVMRDRWLVADMDDRSARRRRR